MSHIKYLLIASLVAAFSLPAGSAMAKKGTGKAKSTKVHTAPKASKESVSKSLPKTKDYDFLADEIDGSRILPDDTTIFGREEVSHRSLIRLRTEFIAEILKSAEML